MSWGPVAVFRSDARMQARNEGTLVITADCTFLERNGQRELLAWPVPETTWDPAFAQISFMRRDGQVVSVRNGQYVVLGGGGSSRNEGGLTGEEWANQVTWVARPKAACLVDERFLVSDVMEEGPGPTGGIEPDETVVRSLRFPAIEIECQGAAVVPIDACRAWGEKLLDGNPDFAARTSRLVLTFRQGNARCAADFYGANGTVEITASCRLQRRC